MMYLLLLPLVVMTFYNLRRWGNPVAFGSVPRRARGEIEDEWASAGKDRYFDRRWRQIDADYLEREAAHFDVLLEGHTMLTPRMPVGAGVKSYQPSDKNVYWGTVKADAIPARLKVVPQKRMFSEYGY